MSRNPFLDRVDKSERTSKAYKRSPKQEKNLAKRLGGLQTPASGSRHKKGDLYVKGVVRVEAKTTQRKSFSVTREDIDKLEIAGMGHDEVPVMIIEFLNAAGKPEREVAVVPMDALEWLIAHAKP